MIIVEGPDGAGKSTLVKSIAEEFRIDIGERGVADRDFLYEVTRSDTYKALAHAMLGNQQPQIWDRLFFSEFVYAPLGMPKREIEFNPTETDWIRGVIRAIGCPIIVCYSRYETMKSNAERHKQMSGVLENFPGICSGYVQGDLFKNMPFVMWYDYSAELDTVKITPGSWKSREQISDSITHYFETRSKRAW